MEIRPREVGSAPENQQAAWSLAYLDVAAKDARSFLNEEQYCHAVQQFEQLAQEVDPRRPLTVDVEPIESYFELRDKGGVLGKINLRVYFAVFDEKRMILVLCCWKKEREGPVPPYMKAKIRSRLRFAMNRLRESQ